VKGETLEIEPAAWGQSVKYRIDGGPWRIYNYPFDLKSGSEAEIRAVRYGWEESEIVSVP
jgi:hypothetical protein